MEVGCTHCRAHELKSNTHRLWEAYRKNVFRAQNGHYWKEAPYLVLGWPEALARAIEETKSAR